ncbi:hypothetical protein GCM10022628_25550 [Anoxybacillus suryakundensis]|uniref:DISARM protein DrmE C-terminal domain-containing protein n=1 Tax=Anoxybacillus suryakundensis TaxID=1325335 RepID=A0A0K6GLH5_9BACL|nr:hypothetical protein Ga0061060_10414 [Anoxybacillus suryakundensis]
MLRHIYKLYSPLQKHIHFKHVKCSELLSFAEQLSNFRQELIEKFDNDGQLLDTYSYLNKIFFKLCGSFLNYSEVIGKDAEKTIIDKLMSSKDSYPSFFDKIVKPLAMSIKQVLETEQNYMTDFLCEHINKNCNRSHKIALITKRALSIEEKELINRRINLPVDINYYTENNFRKSVVMFDEVVFVGTPSYYGSFATNTLKAPHTYFVAYEMFSNKLTQKSFFSDIHQQDIISTIYSNVSIDKEIKNTHRVEISQEDSVKYTIKRVLEEQNEKGENVHNVVKASIVLLENGRFIFVPDDSKIRVLSLNTKRNQVIVNHITLKDLEEDDFIIIRNERDTKLIAEVADYEILREEAEYLRLLQEKWKKRLRYNVMKKGIKRVSEILSNRYGMTTASSQSIRSWCGEECICPTELPLLLQALKYDKNEVDHIYQAMKKIQTAHRDAGRVISRKLMNEITPSICQELQQKGSITFKSSNFNGASFNIDRVVAIDRSKHNVLQSNLMKVYRKDL